MNIPVSKPAPVPTSVAGVSSVRPGRPVWEWSKDGAAVLILLLVFVIFFFPVLFQGQTFFFRDIIQFAFPMKHFVWSAFSQGDLPLWNPAIFSGVPFMPALHPGVFYPPTLLFLLPDFVTAFNLYFLFHHLLLAFSVYALARMWNLSEEAALCSAVTALLGGYFLSLASIYNHFQSAVWLPSVFFFFHKFVVEGRTRYFVGTVVCIACQILGGSPEMCILSTVLLGGYVLIAASSRNAVNGLGRSFLALGAAVMLALGLTAIQWMPTLALLEHAVRGQGMDFQDSTLWSMAPAALTTLLLPENFTTYMVDSNAKTDFFVQSVYMGLLPLFFLFSGLLFLRKKMILFWVTVFGAGVFFALGKHNPLYSFFLDWLPLMDLFRFPEKFFVLAAFALVFLVGFGLDALDNRGTHSGPGWKSFLVLAGWMGAGVVAVGIGEPERDWIPSLGLLLLFGALGTAFYLGRVSAGKFKFAAVALLTIDLMIQNSMLIPVIDKNFYQKVPELTGEVRSEEGFFRVFSGPLLEETVSDKNRLPKTPNLFFSHLALKERLYPNLGTIYGITYADGLMGLELNDPSLWTDLILKSPPEKRLRILARSNVKYWITDEDEIPASPNRPLGKKRVKGLEGVLPRAFLASQARLGKEPFLLNTYYDESFDPETEVLLSEPVTWQANQNFEGTVEEVSYGANRAVIKTRQNAQGFLVLLDAYFPGWRVRVDGEEGHILRANHFYRAVQLGPGSHTVEFNYEPEGFKTGKIITASTLVVVLGMIGVVARRKNTRRKAHWDI